MNGTSSTGLRRPEPAPVATGPDEGLEHSAFPRALADLVESLDTCHSTPGLSLAHAVTAALAMALRKPDWLPADMLEAAQANYARRLIYGDPSGRYSLLAIAWGPGQYSPVHLHHTWCAVGVYQGSLQEWQYSAPVPGQSPRIVSKKARRVGDCTFDPRMTSTHRIANVTRKTAVSIHIYGVAYDRIASGVNFVVA